MSGAVRKQTESASRVGAESQICLRIACSPAGGGGTFETSVRRFSDWIAGFCRPHFSKPFYYKGRRFGILGFAGLLRAARRKGKFE
jgi:hypothetical protein